MKIKQGFKIMPFADGYVAMPENPQVNGKNMLISLNGLGKFLFEKLENECTVEDLVKSVTNTYNVDEKRAKADIEAFIEKLKAQDIIIQE